MRVLVCCLLAGMSFGCGSKENVSLSASLVNPSVGVSAFALGTELSGGFHLRLELGEQAPEATQVALGTFSLRRGQAEVVSALPLAPEGGVTFPLSIAVGEVRMVHMSFDSSSLLEASEGDAICQGPLEIVGTVTDSLNAGKATTAQSPSVTPNCQ